MAHASTVRTAALALALVATIGLAGCITPEQAARAFMDEIGCADFSGVDKQTGRFAYGGAVSCKTGTEAHDWANPSTKASVDWGGAASFGSMELRVLDGLGREVYAERFDAKSAQGSRGDTSWGAPTVPPLSAPWRVEVDFQNFTGAMGLELRSGG